MAFAEDLSPFFSTTDFAVTAAWTPSVGGPQQTAQVLLDSPDLELFSGAVQSRQYAIIYAVNQLVGLKTSESITVNGVNHVVREVAAVDDGKIMHATLRRP